MNRNRFASPRTFTADALVAVVATAQFVVAAGVKWVSAAAAEASGEEPTGRIIARRAETRVPTAAEREAAVALANRVVTALRGSSRSFDQSLAVVASAIVRGGSVSIPGAASVAAYLPFWAALQASREASRPAPESGLGGLLGLFAKAATRLRFPRITFEGLPEVGTLKLQRAASGKNAGGINITDGRPFGENRFYGALTASGEFRPGRDLTPAIREFLTRLAADPARVAGEYGKGSGNCCFCHRGLTDDRSVVVGYGPICAGHYGLPWGDEAR